MSKYKDQECLKARTIHIKGVLPEDLTGDGIESYLNSILKRKDYGFQQQPGKVLSTLIIPDFTKQLDIEAGLMDLRDFKKIIDVDPPLCSCLIPGKYKD